MKLISLFAVDALTFGIRSVAGEGSEGRRSATYAAGKILRFQGFPRTEGANYHVHRVGDRLNRSNFVAPAVALALEETSI